MQKMHPQECKTLHIWMQENDGTTRNRRFFILFSLRGMRLRRVQ